MREASGYVSFLLGTSAHDVARSLHIATVGIAVGGMRSFVANVFGPKRFPKSSRGSVVTDAAQSGSFRIGGAFDVSRLGFGAMRIVGSGIWRPPEDRAEAMRTFRQLPCLGVNFHRHRRFLRSWLLRGPDQGSARALWRNTCRDKGRRQLEREPSQMAVFFAPRLRAGGCQGANGDTAAKAPGFSSPLVDATSANDALSWGQVGAATPASL